MSNDVRVNFWLNDDLHEYLKERKRKTGRSMSDILRELINKEIRKKGKEENLFDRFNELLDRFESQVNQLEKIEDND